MDCDVCMEAFDAGERRPKLLPCGHTYCLSCVSRQERKCPVDRKAFRISPDKLPDNYKLIELSQRPPTVFGWCRTCKSGASEHCLDEHTPSICSLKKARLETIQPRLDALRAGETALVGLQKVVEESAKDISMVVTGCCDRLKVEQTQIGEARKSLDAALSVEAAIWIKMEKAEPPEDYALADGAAQLLSDLAEPSTVCELTVHRGAAGTAPGPVAWRGSVLPQRDAASRLALCRLLCTGELRLEEPRPTETMKSDDTWEERSNEKIMSPEEMVAAVHVGSRVARGSCWRVAWNNDASSEEGVVTSVLDGGRVRVRWVQGGPEFVYSMTPTTQHLRLVPRRPMVQLGRKDAKSLNLSEISMKSTLQRSLPTAKLAEAKVLYGLRCDLAPNWSMKVLRSVARHVEALSLESAQQQHLKAACDCARLSTLHLRGRAVQVGPVVDLTVEVSGTGPSPSTSGGSSNGSAPVAARDPVEEAFDAAPLPARIQELRVTCVIREQLMQLHRLTSLRRLEVHSPFEAPLLNLSFPTAGASGLEWLRVGLYPLTTALALMRAHAGSLRVLELVAASREPYGCPDLADQLSRCGFQVLERIVLWRGSVTEVFCWHEVAECAMQKNTLLVALSNIKVMCSDCDQVEETELN